MALHPKLSFDALIKTANECVETVSLEEALKLIHDDSTQFVDIRDVREIQREGMIPGAFHCPRGMLEFWVHPESPYHKSVFDQPEKKFVFYCGSAWRSALATRDMQELGLSPVAHIEGGFAAWQAAGGAIDKKR